MTDSPYCKVVEPQPTTFEEAIDKLGYSMSAFRAVLPELSELSSFRLDEAVRLANRVVKRGLADHDRLIGETNQAPLRSQELRRQASSVLSQARVKAALWLLESQVVAFIPVAGELFPLQTLPILASISVDLYGGEIQTIKLQVGEAVEACCAKWRVRWKDLQAKRLAREALSIVSADFVGSLATPTDTNPAAAGKRVGASLRGGKQLTVGPFEKVKQKIRELKKARLPQRKICEILAGNLRPPNAAWRGLRWLDAYNDKRYHGSVKTWLSRLQ